MTQFMLDKAFGDRLRLRLPMSYRVTIAGKPVEMDSPEEVFELLKSAVLNGNPREAAIEAGPTRHEWDEDRASQFIADLQPGSLQMRVIWTIYHADCFSREDLLAMMQIADPQQLGGTFSGLIKNAKRLGAPSPLFIKRIRDTKGHRTYEYALDPAFRKAIESLEPIISPKSDLSDLRAYISGQRAALAGFMNSGALLTLADDVLKVTPTSPIYVRYLTDNLGVLAELASAHYERPIRAQLTAVATVKLPDKKATKK